jgi:8-oxo-dGTP diphosphatase
MSEGLPRIGSAVIVRDEANRILLGRRNKDPQRGSWVLPGGKIHAFESIAEAAARELEEETGLKIEVQGQFRVYEIVNPPDEHRIIIYSWGRARGGIPKASDDLSDVRFVPVEELGDLMTTPLVRQVLADAGFIHSEPLQYEPPKEQTSFLLLPVAIARRQHRYASRPSQRRRKRLRSVTNLSLQFSDNICE